MWTHSTPEAIENLLKRCGDISYQMLQHTERGYLGSINIDIKPIRMGKNHEFVCQLPPYSRYRISNEEGLMWRPRNQVIQLCTQVTVQDLLNCCECILFQVYKSSGYGTLTIDFSCIEPTTEYKFILRWLPSYQEVGLIRLNSGSESADFINGFS